MGSLITDAMLETFAVVAAWDDLARAIGRRCRGHAHRIALYLPYRPGERDEFWKRLVLELAETT